MSITVGRFHFDDVITNFKNRDIESTTTKVKDSDFFVFLFIQSVSQCRSRWLVNNTFNFKTRNFTGIFCRLSLSIVKISRNGNYGLSDFVTKIVFGRLF